MSSPTFPHHRGLLMLSITLMVTVYFLDSLSIALANRYVSGGLGADQRSYVYATAAYSVAVIVFTAPHQWFVQHLGYRHLMMAATVVHTIGQLLCLAGDHLWVFATGRVFMGAAAATFFAGARVLVLMFFPGPQTPTGIRAFASGVPLGAAMASFCTAQLLAHEEWRGIFAVPLVVCLVMAVCIWMAIPSRVIPEKLSARPALLPTAILLVGSIIVETTIQRMSFDFYSDTWELLGLFLLGICLMAVFIYCERQRERPTLDFRNAINPAFLLGMLFMMLNYFMLGAYNYVIPQYVLNALQVPIYTAGTVMAIGWLCGIVPLMAITSGTLKRYFPWGGFKKFLVLGYSLLAGYGFWMSSQNGEVPLVQQLQPALMMHGVFLISTFAVIIMYTFMTIPPRYFSQAYQVKNMTQQIVMPLGIVMANVFLQWRDAFHANVLRSHITSFNPLYQQYREQLNEAMGHASMSQMASLVNRQAAILGFLDYFYLIGWVGVILAIYMLLQRHFR
ncbi:MULTISPECIES: MFS transporter [unclassified Pseudomonas]|uniref:MFS transporter n=1 Tax=unclassified Pseudomonas TaxID=196821 RepID=UPI002580380D|nr:MULTISPECIES: MFS transporter [unclassified Pseudomonas]